MATPLPEWAVPGAKFATQAGWGDGIGIYTITRVSKTSAWARYGNETRETRWVDGGSVGVDSKGGRVLVLYGADRWSRRFGYTLDSEQGKRMQAQAREQIRRARIRKAFHALDHEWTVDNANELRRAVIAWGSPGEGL